MGQFNINISGGNAPYTVSVKKVGDNTERWINGGTTGSGLVTFTSDTGTVSYDIVVSKNGCTTATGNFSLACNVPTVPTPSPTNSCDIVITSVNIQCNGNNSSTVTVFANSPSGKTLRYGILGFVDFQAGNTFELVNSDSNGYTFIVAELGHENTCRATTNRVVNCVTPTTPTPTVPTPVTPTPVSCNLSISSVDVTCVSSNNGTVTVNVNNPNGYSLQYQIDGYITWQSSNVFNNITNGTNYTIRVRNSNNTSCEAITTASVNCTAPSPTTPTPVSCNLGISNVNVTCQGANNGTITVTANNPNNYTLQYQLDNLVTWQSSNTFSGITNGTTYTVRVRNANNTSCEASSTNVVVDCQSVPTPVTPTPSPVSPVPSPISPTPTPVSCTGITNLTIIGSSSVVANSQNSYTSSYSGDAPSSYSWSISGQGTNVIGASNGSSVTFQMGNSNGTITLTVVNCAGTFSVDFPFSIQSTPTPVTPTPTPVGCPTITLTSGNETFNGTNNVLPLTISGGVAPYLTSLTGNSVDINTYVSGGTSISSDLIYREPSYSFVASAPRSNLQIYLGNNVDMTINTLDTNSCPGSLYYFRDRRCAVIDVTNNESFNVFIVYKNCVGNYSPNSASTSQYELVPGETKRINSGNLRVQVGGENYNITASLIGFL